MTSSPTAPPSPREEDFRALFEAAGDAIFLVEDMRFVACNHGTLALFGCAREDILGRRPWEFSPPRQADGTDSETGVRARVARALAGEPQFFEWRHRRLDGSPFDTEVQLNRIDLPEGPVLQAMVRDISERKRAEAGLRLYQRIVADSTDHIAVLDLDYIYRLVNGTYLDAHGRDEAEIVGHGVAELFGHAVFENLIKEKLDRCFAGEVVRYQTWFEFKARGRRYMNVTYTPHRDQDGNVRGAIVSSRDITDLHLAQEALTESEARNRAILDTAVDGILVVDEASRVVYANPAICRFTGHDAEALLNRPLTDLMPERFRDRHETGFGNYLASGQATMPWRELAFVLLHRDGHEIPVEVSIGERSGAGPRQFIGILRDVTERRRAQDALREREEHINLLLDSMAEGMYGVDTRGDCTFINPAGLRLLGYEDAEALLGRHMHEVIHHSHADGRHYPAADCRAYQASVVGHGIHVDDEVFWRRDGSSFPVEYWSYPMRRGGRVIGSVVTFMDIGERRKSEARLRQSAKVFDSTTDGVTITDAAANIIAINRAFTEITGYTEAEALGRNPRLLKSGRHDESFYQSVWQCLAQTGSWSGEIWNRKKNGEIYPEWLTISSVTNGDGRLTNYVGVFADISQIKQSEAKLERLAHYDPLTDLPNRLLFNARLEHAIRHAERNGTLLALLFIDLDRFKTVNDGLGHPAGDRMLREVAQRLSHCVRAEDTVARLGGDEFVIVLEGLDNTTPATVLADKLLVTLTRPFGLDGQEVFIGASIGISTYPADGADATTLLKNADAAMYRSKEDGRNTYRFYDAEMTRSARERLVLETNLRQAIAQQEFVLHYQPQVDVASGEMVGVEALVRWDHPVSGLISPIRFIPLAEENGLILPMGEWVLFAACAQARAWHETAGMPPLTMAVNLSPRQFRQEKLAEHVRAVLDATGLPPARLELEITESALMDNADQAVATLRALKDLGIQISMDDFGTGYSSLAQLKRFPIDKLKIDQSFMRGIPHDQSDMEIVATIIAMARNLHLKVLAEGVETEAQLAFLQIHGCDTYQGYHRSRPLPARALEAWLAANREP
jgi:diguanylate cyclase (GGDEF)-like protein/PAS domain S-box-containing protein